MLFKKEFHSGLKDGSITLTFRRWARPQVKVGGRYRVGGMGVLEVDSVERVRVRDLRRADARSAGFPDRPALLAFLRAGGPGPLRETTVLFRVAFHYAGQKTGREPPAPDSKLTAKELEALAARLDRMDRSSKHGPWTRTTLAIIACHPRVAASKLARCLGRKTAPFKTDVRKLKKLGLTLSFEVGYEISPRGRALLARVLP